HLEIVRANAAGDSVDNFLRGFIFDKKSPQFSTDEPRACWLPDKNVDDVIAIKGAGVAHELLRSEILLHPCKTKLLRGHVDPVAVFDFLNACSEMTVPEKSHLLQKRRRAIHHSLEPPAAEIENLISLHHAELPCRFAKIFAALLCGFERRPRCANVTRLRPGGRRNISRIGAHIDKFSHHG